MYIWQQSGWPNLTWNAGALSTLVSQVTREQGRLLGRMEALGFDLRSEAHLRTLTLDVVKSSEIEGEMLDTAQVRSSIARRLGMDVGGLVPVDRDLEGVVEMMLDASGNPNDPLTEERLFAWHAALFPTGRSGMRRIRIGAWRDDSTGPMQVVSGPVGREEVHYEAPPAAGLPGEVRDFLAWFETASLGEALRGDPLHSDPLLRAGLAHLWFVTLHPFADGNGRIARAISDLALARSENTNQRFYSMSSQIRRERKDYYAILQRTQSAGLDVTPWLEWFLGCLARAFDTAEHTLESVLRKSLFWQRFATQPLNERQVKVLNRLLDGFEGNLTTSKWAKIAKCSQDTALRDILDLIERGALRKNPGGGRSTSYSLGGDS